MAEERIYFLGIGGTLMGNLAILAKQAGYDVSGSDQKIYPPMSDQLAAAQIPVEEGFERTHLNPPPDVVVIGNANLPRGAESLEFVLDEDIPYMSGAEWLGRNVLAGRHVFAVAGTHGKTTTTGMLTWILESAGKKPGFLVGGAPLNFEASARLGSSTYFVVEADEYDTSYFDRQAKFMHYRPRTLLINNIEFDHADIYTDLGAIQFQFHHLVRTVPRSGRIIAPWGMRAVDEVLEQGTWTPISYTSVDPTNKELEATKNVDFWHAKTITEDGSIFDLFHNRRKIGSLEWQHYGHHNVSNALQSITAAREAGVSIREALDALASFEGVKRRMEIIATRDGLTVYDDFAHHPTAILTTLQGLRNRVGLEHILAVVEPRSHTMQMGTHREPLTTCCSPADDVIWFKGDNVDMDLDALAENNIVPSEVMDDLGELVDKICEPVDKRRHVVLMSNGGFGGIYEMVRERLL
ncbi:MAG: UDP-N-acetylmuramate:L-alanyl-gamma-D-glutamyl-meso-diaminopimelate ligase [Gammaproteobacteria bacterium]|nr:UDP-N-acetylmuramate:L-alanyl-gamma-D-glutamyl-meso-diaminopimelate ligase [Gammaproteobacteria bacterium]